MPKEILSVLVAFLSCSYIVTLVVVAHNRSKNTIITEMKRFFFKYFNDFFRVCRNDGSELHIYAQAGEMNYRHYQEYVDLIKDKIDRLHKENIETHFKLKIVCGKRIMVKSLQAELHGIHPLVSLLYSERYKKYIEIYIVNRERLPYHFLYSPSLDYGIAEAPHQELSTTLTWAFDANEDIKNSFIKYRKKIELSYKVEELLVRDGDLFLGDKILVRRKTSDNQDNSVDSINYNEVFFEDNRKYWLTSFLLRDSINEEINTHKTATNLLMTGWNPISDEIFVRSDRSSLLGDENHELL